MSRLIVEDGSVVPGANSYGSLQEAATFHAEHGGLLPVLELASSGVTFAPDGVITGSVGAFAGISAATIVEFRATSEPENSGFAYVTAATDTTLTVLWLDTVDESAGATVRITVYEQSGWWATTSARMEAALINAATFMRHRYAWSGVVVSATQPLAWPRRFAFVDPGTTPDELFPSSLGIGWTELGSNEVPAGAKRCQFWLALADLDAPLLAPVDPQKFLKAKSIGTGGISKTFEGKIRLRRFHHADAEVSQLLVFGGNAGAAGPFIPIVRV